jgi:hypothetical protein
MIANRLEDEVEPFKPVSKDHTRANRIGINLEHLKSLETIKESTGEARNLFRYERRSIDQTKKSGKNIF